MAFLSSRTVIAFMSIVAVVLSITPDSYYFECEQYPGDQWDQIDKTNRECMREDVDGVDTMFCHHWECEVPECPEEEQVTWGDGCKACPGSCSEGGKIRPEGGDSFTCVDNTNICSCTTQGFSTTLMGYNRELFCNAAMGQ
uniref:Uncharacterized protein n=1 Tax=Magallana gigas TaxID=29159 RepID=A0A8W8JEK2_MAGGI|nr:uncharacterized protein LOC105324693 [Crassostrea gigas]